MYLIQQKSRLTNGFFLKKTKLAPKKQNAKRPARTRGSAHTPQNPNTRLFHPRTTLYGVAVTPWYICVSRASYIIAFLASQFSNASMLLCSRVTHAQRHAGFTPPKPRRKRRAHDDDDDNDGSQGDIHDSLRREINQIRHRFKESQAQQPTGLRRAPQESSGIKRRSQSQEEPVETHGISTLATHSGGCPDGQFPS